MITDKEFKHHIIDLSEKPGGGFMKKKLRKF